MCGSVPLTTPRFMAAAATASGDGLGSTCSCTLMPICLLVAQAKAFHLQTCIRMKFIGEQTICECENSASWPRRLIFCHSLCTSSAAQGKGTTSLHISGCFLSSNMHQWEQWRRLSALYVQPASYHRSVFIHCSQSYNYTANYGRPLILLKTHVVLVRVAYGSNVQPASCIQHGP